MCDLGHEHWGVYGAAGLLVYHHDASGVAHVLLQHRARWSHNGGTWGVPGGARDSHESAEAAALREATEEAALDGRAVRISGTIRDHHGGWAYETVLAAADRLLPARAVNLESRRITWVPVAEVTDRKLHPGFAETWPRARAALGRLVLVVDVANVMGARADGWWRDRAGAAARLRDGVSARLALGLSSAVLPSGIPLPDLDHWYPEVVMVVEGQARDVAATGQAQSREARRSGWRSGEGPAGQAPSVPGIRVVAAPGGGDDTIVAEAQAAAAAPDDHVVVVTADRGLRARVTAAGAATAGPRWLLSLIDGS